MSNYSESERIYLNNEPKPESEDTFESMAQDLGIDIDEELPESPRVTEAKADPEVDTSLAKPEDMVVAPGEEITPEQAPPEQEKSFGEELKAEMAQTFESQFGLEADIIKSGAGATLDVVEGIANTSIDVANWVEKQLQANGLTEQDIIDNNFKLSFAEEIIPESEEGELRLQRALMRYIVPFGAARKALNTTKMASHPWTRDAMAAAVSSFVAIDPDEENLGNMVKNNPEFTYPVLMAMLEPLAEMTAIEERDSAIVRRGKNAFESIVTDGLFLGAAKATGMIMSGGEVLYKTVRGARKARKFTGKEAKLKAQAEEIKAESAAMDKEIRKAKKEAKLKDRPVSTKDLGLKSDQSLRGLEKTPNTFMAVARNIKENVDELNASLPTKLTDEEVAKRADKLMQNPEMAKRLQDKIDAGEVLNKEEQRAGIEAYIRHVHILEEAAKTFRAAPTRENGLAFAKVKENTLILSKIVKGSGPEAGAALRQRRVAMEAAALDVEKHIKMANELELRGGVDNLLEEADEIIEMGTVARHKKDPKIMDDALEIKPDNKETWKEKAIRYRTAQLLTSVQTIALPLWSAMVRLPAALGETGLAALYSTEIKVGGKVIREGAKPGDKVFFSEVPAMAKGFMEGAVAEGVSIIHGMLDAFRLNTKLKELAPAVSKNIDQIQNSKVYGGLTETGLAVKQNRANMEDVAKFNKLKPIEVDPEKTHGTWLGKSMKMTAALVSRGSLTAISSVDNIVKTVAQRGKLRAEAVREGMARGLRDDELAEFVEVFINDKQKVLRPAVAEVREQAVERSAQFAKELTFTNELTGGFAKASEFMDNPIGRIISPFFRMGLNSLDQSLQYAPGLRRFSSMGNLAELKKNGGPEWAIAQGKVAMGTTIGAATAMFTFSGHMTGRAPANPEQRRRWKQAGGQEYAFRFGDTYIPFERVGEPFSRIMKASSDLAQAAGFVFSSHSNPNLKKDFEELSQQWVLIVGDLVNPDFFADGFGQMIEGFENPDKGSVQDFLDDLALSFLPLSSGLRQARRGLDPVRRETSVEAGGPMDVLEEKLNKLMDRIPGFSSMLEPQMDMFAEVQHYPPGFGPDIISPVYVTQFTKDPVRREILRLGAAGPLVNPEPKPGEEHLVMKMPARRLNRTVHGVTAPMYLDNQQYTRLVELSAGKNFPGMDMTLHDRMNMIISNDYPMLDENQKTDQNKRRVLGEVVMGYRRAAKAQLTKEIESEFRFQMMEHALDVQQASIVGDEI